MHQHSTQTQYTVWHSSENAPALDAQYTVRHSSENAPALDTQCDSSECTSTGHKHSVTHFRKCTSTRQYTVWHISENAPALDTVYSVTQFRKCTSTGHKYSIQWVTWFRKCTNTGHKHSIQCNTVQKMHQHWAQTQYTVWHGSENAPALGTNTVYSVTQFRKYTCPGHKWMCNSDGQNHS